MSTDETPIGVEDLLKLNKRYLVGTIITLNHLLSTSRRNTPRIDDYIEYETMIEDAVKTIMLVLKTMVDMEKEEFDQIQGDLVQEFALLISVERSP